LWVAGTFQRAKFIARANGKKKKKKRYRKNAAKKPPLEVRGLLSVCSEAVVKERALAGKARQTSSSLGT